MAEEQDVQPQVPVLRERFLSKYADKLGDYDHRDVDKVKTNDAYCRNVLRMLKVKGDAEKGADVLTEILAFRKEYEVNDLTEDKIPQEILDRNALFYKNQDNQGHTILHFKVEHWDKKRSEMLPGLKSLICLRFEEHARAHPEERAVVMFDMTNAGITNMDLDVTKFIINAFTSYFPSYLAYMVMYEMPFVLNAIWTIIKGWLNEDQKKRIVMAKKKDIQKYINADNLEDHMK